jgi:hypothetical protein
LWSLCRRYEEEKVNEDEENEVKKGIKMDRKLVESLQKEFKKLNEDVRKSVTFSVDSLVEGDLANNWNFQDACGVSMDEGELSSIIYKSITPNGFITADVVFSKLGESKTNEHCGHCAEDMKKAKKRPYKKGESFSPYSVFGNPATPEEIEARMKIRDEQRKKEKERVNEGKLRLSLYCPHKLGGKGYYFQTSDGRSSAETDRAGITQELRKLGQNVEQILNKSESKGVVSVTVDSETLRTSGIPFKMARGF